MKDKEGYFKIVKGPPSRNQNALLYAPSNWASNYMKKTLTELKRSTDKSTFIVRYSNTYGLVIDRISKLKNHKEYKTI